MRKYFVVCFELGYEVEDMTELYNSLAGGLGMVVLQSAQKMVR